LRLKNNSQFSINVANPMICISVTPTSRKLAKVDILNASRNCDMIEVCLDHLAKEPDVGDLISGFDKPILVSCRRKADGGHFTGTEEQRLGLLRQAIGAGPDYIELELDIAGSVPRFGKTKRVISYTSIDRPLGKIDDIFIEAYKANADVVKFTCPTPNLDAAWPLLAAVAKKRELPVVGMGLGRPGITFSLLGRKFGSPWIYAALEKGMEAHEGQPSIFELDELYDWKEIGEKTKLVGVVGFGPRETLTVRILNAGFKLLEKETRCLPLEIGGLDKLAKRLETLRVNMLVVRPELSTEALEFAEHAEEAAQQSGYADLLLKQKNGWNAYNMIWRSALKAIEDKLGKENSDDRPLDRRNVLVVGANGTAQAMIHGIHRRKGVVSVTAPNDKQAQRVAKQFGIRVVPFASLYDTLADLVILTDPNLKMGHKKSEMNAGYFRTHMTVLDVCRLPSDSPFCFEARQRGCKIVEPADVYIDQLSAQFKAIAGQDLPVEAYQSILAEQR